MAAGAAGGALLLGMTGVAVAAGGPTILGGTDAPEGATHENNGYTIDSHTLQLEESDYTKIANKEGAFFFNQDGVTPNDELFNVFGTAITSMRSKPANELVVGEPAEGAATYYINIGGNIKENFSVNLEDMEEESEEQTMVCSCATGAPFGQAAVVGVPLAPRGRYGRFGRRREHRDRVRSRRLRPGAAPAVLPRSRCASGL
ncbi:MAG: hypothetical protein ACLT98_11220 [Eggerthellaceae bacterium]